jgi:hypothetical protein
LEKAGVGISLLASSENQKEPYLLKTVAVLNSNQESHGFLNKEKEIHHFSPSKKAAVFSACILFTLRLLSFTF